MSCRALEPPLHVGRSAQPAHDTCGTSATPSSHDCSAGTWPASRALASLLPPLRHSTRDSASTSSPLFLHTSGTGAWGLVVRIVSGNVLHNLHSQKQGS